MKFHSRHICLTAIVLLLMTTTLPAEDISVSGKVKNLNSDPRFAYNPDNGIVLVTWTQYYAKKANFAKVWAAILRVNNGKLTHVDQFALTNNKSYNAHPFPFFNEEKRYFFVVWDQANPAVIDSASDIKGRMISGDGKIDGGIVTVLSNGKRSEYPQLYGRFFDTGAPAPADRALQVNLAIQMAELSSDGMNNLGFNWTLVNDNYKALDPPRCLVQGGIANIDGVNRQQGVIPYGFGSTSGGNVYIPVVKETFLNGGLPVFEIRLLAIDQQDWLADSRTLSTGLPVFPTRTAATTIQIADGGTLVIGGLLEQGDAVNYVSKVPFLGDVPIMGFLFNRQVRSNTRDHLLIIITPRVIDPAGETIPAKKTAAGFQFFAVNDGNLYFRRMAETGKLFGGEKKMFSHDNTLEAMANGEIVLNDGDGNPVVGKKAEILTVWQKKLSNKRHEIRANFSKIKR